MNHTFRRIGGYWLVGFTFIGLGELGCLSDDSDPEEGSGGSTSSTSSTGSGGNTATNTTTSGTTGSTGDNVCASPITLSSSTPAIADFELYDGGADLATWSFALGGDAATGVFTGPFRYGDDVDGFPETFEMVEGHESSYALSISDTLSEEYGGGIGLWISECLDATAFSGISFWVRGDAPAGEAKFNLLMEETTWVMADSVGTCEAEEEAGCVHPSVLVPVTEEWTQVQVAWSDFTDGSTPNGAVTADGTNIWQIQFDVGLEWLPDDEGVYQPTPSGYEFAIDDLTFY